MRVEFCGECHVVTPGSTFAIGRDAELTVDENRYLHRRFLELDHHAGMWWIGNVGSRLSATLSDPGGSAIAWIAPGVHMPLVFSESVVRFTAGPTSYELRLLLDAAPYVPVDRKMHSSGETTLGGVSLVGEQRALVAALAEPMLTRAPGQVSVMPSSAEAAARLGWTVTKFNRKLDAVCQKLERAGIKGLHGHADRLATNRRARLVEFAVAARLVTVDDLHLLEAVVESQ